MPPKVHFKDEKHEFNACDFLIYFIKNKEKKTEKPF